MSISTRTTETVCRTPSTTPMRSFSCRFTRTERPSTPGTGFETEIGEGKGKGFTVNLPLPEYPDDEVYVRAFGEIFPPLWRRTGLSALWRR